MTLDETALVKAKKAFNTTQTLYQVDSLINSSLSDSSLATAALSTTRSGNTAVVVRPSSTDAAIEASKDAYPSLTTSTEQRTVFTSPYAIVKGQQVRFQHQSGTWLAHVVDVWGQEQTLPRDLCTSSSSCSSATKTSYQSA